MILQAKLHLPGKHSSPSHSHSNPGDPPFPPFPLRSEKNKPISESLEWYSFHILITPSPALIVLAVRRILRSLTAVDPEGEANPVEEKTTPAVKPFVYQDIFETAGPDTTVYRKISSDYVSTIEVDGKKILKVAPEGLTYP